ncbi:MAG: hypothetical protein P8M79_02430 [Alphaproteobacteria bacterium]|nr:hypothetical protein [Alphaproteobacteria bacterium]
MTALEPGETRAVPSPFDPDSLRVTGDVNTIGAEKLLIRLPVRKPNKPEFFRVRADAEYRLPCAVLEIKVEREVYLVTPEVLPFLAEDVRHVELRLCQNRQGVAFFWPVPMPGPDGRTNSWHESARDAAALAEGSWVRMLSNMAEGAYSIYRAKGKIPDPEWPEKTFQELLTLAFKDGKLIDSEDHPVVKQMYGE